MPRIARSASLRPTDRLRPVPAWLVAAAVAVTATVAVSCGSGAAPPTDVGANTTASSAGADAPRARSGGSATRLVLTGDSVGLLIGTAVSPLADELGVVFENRANWVCGVTKVSRYRHEGGTITDAGRNCYWPETWAPESLSRFKPDVVAIVQGGTGLGDWEVEGEFRGPCDPVFDRWYTDALGTEIDRLGATGATVVVTTAPPPRPYPALAGLDARAECANRSVRAAAAAHGAAVVDLAGYVCPDGQCVTERDGVVLRPDGVHFTKEGATHVARWLVPQLTSASP